MVEKKIDLKLESFEESDNKFIFTARSLTKDFVCEDGLKRLSEDSKNKALIWRHEHPVNPKFTNTHIYGRVLESTAENGEIISKYELYGHTKEHEMVKELIRKRNKINKPISISMRFREYLQDKNPIHYDVIEHSLTPTPACKECVLLDIKNEGDLMPEKNLEKEIKELEEKLTKKEKAYEELSAKVIELEKSVETKDEELEESKTSKDELSKQLISFKDQLNEQAKMIEKLNEDLFTKDVEPLINQLVKLDGEEMKSVYLDASRKEKGKEFLLERIKELEDRLKMKPKVTSLEQSAADAMKDEELEEDEKTKQKRDSDAFMYMPTEFHKEGDK